MTVRSIDVDFRNTPARVLALCCSDGRFVDAVEELVADLGIANHDLIAFPGGPAHLNAFSSMLLEHQAINDATNFMIKAHGTETVLLIAHYDCAYYKKRFGRSDETRQRDDLAAASEHIQLAHPDIRILRLFFRPLPGGGMNAEEVPLPSPP